MRLHTLLKSADRFLGRGICRLLPPPGKAGSVRPGRILVIRPGGIGDAVLLAPALNLLRGHFPGAVLTVLAETRNSGVFELVPSVDQVLRYDVFREFRQVFLQRPDLVIDSEQSHRLSAVVARLAGAGSSIGFGSNDRARLFHHSVPYSHDDYEAKSFFRLLTVLAIPTPPRLVTPFLAVPEPARRRAAGLLAPLAGRPFAALFAGASIPERQWPANRFRTVAEGLARQGLGVVVVGGGEDRGAGDRITQGLAAGLNLAGHTSLAETAALLKAARLLLSGDSGVLHLAVGLNVPTVSLFGPGIEKKWAPKGNRHLVLNKRLPCSPCTRFGTTPPCPRRAGCLEAIQPDEVLQALRALLA